jgi:alkanesulfonate monooxygenase SsuD/methylene tetrahydromethanopterin reductase-like flavin-dependent oxidoreductase (luciferase family)
VARRRRLLTGEFVSFSAVRLNPKPARDRRIPFVLGGNSDAALRRAAAWGDGWYGFNLPDVAAVCERVATLQRLCREASRSVTDPARGRGSRGARSRERRRWQRPGWTSSSSSTARPRTQAWSRNGWAGWASRGASRHIAPLIAGNGDDVRRRCTMRRALATALLAVTAESAPPLVSDRRPEVTVKPGSGTPKLI